MSVLLPTHDAGSELLGALRSLCDQTLADVEIVLVDDGSTDGSVDQARRDLDADSRLRILAPGRIGLPAALNAGLAACRAELVARMDADDVARPERLERQRLHLEEHPEVAILGCQVRTFADGGAGQGYRLFDAWQNGLLTHAQIAREIYVESPLSHPSVMYRARAIRELGGYRDVPWAEDYDLWLRANLAGARFAKLAEVLLEGRDRPDRVSRRDPRYGKKALLACKAHYLARGPLSAGRKALVWGAGPTGRALARQLRHEGATVAAFVDVDPKKIGVTRAGGAPTLSLDELERRAGTVLLGAVAARGARARIREHAVGLGYEEGRDLFFAA